MSKASQAARSAVRHTRRQGEHVAKSLRLVAEAASPPFKPQDVWDWTREKYRVRAIVLLLINAALFVGLCCFMFWLRTGRFTPFFTDDYWDLWIQAFDPVRDEQITLIDYLVYPIPAERVPMMLVIMGLVLASLTAIPILVSILYRFPFSLIFTAIIMFVAVTPWLALTVTLCCYLASLRFLRFSFRYATALIALLPSVVYYAMASRNASMLSDLQSIDIAKLYVPPVLALVGACVVMAVVLLVAKLVNYRPGAIAPSMAVMFAMPVLLFEAKVGRDELYYRLLEAHYGPRSKTCFVSNKDLSGVVGNIVARRQEELGGSAAGIREQVEQSIKLCLEENGEAFASEQDEAVRASRRFRETYPQSDYIPAALYIEGRARDIRIDVEYLRGELGTRFGDSATPDIARALSPTGRLLVRYYDDFPADASKPVWEELHSKFPAALPALVATYRLACLEARNGSMDRAVSLLDDLARMAAGREESKPSVQQASVLQGLLAKQSADLTLDIDVESVAQEGRKLKELLVKNRDHHQQDLALRMLLRMDPHHVLYRDNLSHLLKEIEAGRLLTRLGDNIRLRLALTESSTSLRIDRLKALIEEFSRDPASDALPRAWFELGLTYQMDSRIEEARQAYERVLRQYGDSAWAIEAKSRTAATGAAAQGRGG